MANGAAGTDNVFGDDDYYAFLNVSKNASTEEIRNAYKTLSKRFHPDKHSDPVLKNSAEAMFNRLKKVYDVLGDPQKRAIYDTLGASGIETEGWALVERKFKSAQEIKEEYEQMLREKEERRLQQRTNPKGSITVLIDATDIFEHFDIDSVEEEDEENGDDSGTSYLFWPTIEVRSMSISQSIEAPLTTEKNIGLNGTLNVRNGIGSGNVAATLRHVFSPLSWCEAEFGAGQGPTFSAKYFRSLTQDIHGTAQGYFHVTPYGIRPGVSFILTRQFNKNFVGYLNWKAGAESSLATVAVYENSLCRVNGSVSLSLRHSFVSTSYTHKFKQQDARLKVGVKVGTVGVLFEYGCEARVSQHSIFGAAMSVGTYTGVTLRLKLNRNQQNYIFPIILSEEMLPSSIFYGSIVPAIAYYCVKSFFIDPFLAKREEDELKREKQEHSAKISEKRKDAAAYRALMRESYSRIVDRESQTAGLIVERAIYGEPGLVTQFGNDGRTLPDTVDAFDVTVAVQVMLNDNATLVFSDVSKSYLPGFFDCHFGGPKKLFIRYRYHNAIHQVVLDERESAQLPNDRHRIRR